MVNYATTLVGAAALFARLAAGLPSPQDGLNDSALGLEVAVSAPDGIPITDTVELARYVDLSINGLTWRILARIADIRCRSFLLDPIVKAPLRPLQPLP